MGYSFRLTARVLLYAPSHRQDSRYHGLCYTSRGALVGTRNSSMKDRSDDPSHHERTLLPRSYISLTLAGTRNNSMKDRSDDPSHHERTLLPRSYISLPLAGTRNSSMKDRFDDPSHHERTLLPRSYISLLPSFKKPRGSYLGWAPVDTVRDALWLCGFVHLHVVWRYVHRVFARHPARGRKEGHVLFNDALNTFYLRLYGVRYNGKGPLR